MLETESEPRCFQWRNLTTKHGGLLVPPESCILEGIVNNRFFRKPKF